MQVSVENTSTLERRMTVQVPEERVKSEVDKRLGELRGTVRIPGFRPGKVPGKVINQRFGRQVRDEVIGEMMQSSFFEALQQESLNPAGGVSPGREGREWRTERPRTNVLSGRSSTEKTRHSVLL